MGNVPKVETERDKKLIADYLLKEEGGRWQYSISQLGVKYAREENGDVIPLSPVRIHQILSKHGVAKKRVLTKKNKNKSKK